MPAPVSVMHVAGVIAWAFERLQLWLHNMFSRSPQTALIHHLDSIIYIFLRITSRMISVLFLRYIPSVPTSSPCRPNQASHLTATIASLAVTCRGWCQWRHLTQPPHLVCWLISGSWAYIVTILFVQRFLCVSWQTATVNSAADPFSLTTSSVGVTFDTDYIQSVIDLCNLLKCSLWSFGMDGHCDVW